MAGRRSAPRTGPGASRRFPRSIRLRKSADYDLVHRTGSRLDYGILWVRYRPMPGCSPRFGLAVSRRVGKAVVRNRVKRWIREAIRHERGDLTGVDVVFVARPSAAAAGYLAVRRAVARAMAEVAAQGGE